MWSRAVSSRRRNSSVRWLCCRSRTREIATGALSVPGLCRITADRTSRLGSNKWMRTVCRTSSCSAPARRPQPRTVANAALGQAARAPISPAGRAAHLLALSALVRDLRHDVRRRLRRTDLEHRLQKPVQRRRLHRCRCRWRRDWLGCGRHHIRFWSWNNSRAPESSSSSSRGGNRARRRRRLGRRLGRRSKDEEEAVKKTEKKRRKRKDRNRS